MVGAGLGGLGAAISILLAGHSVLVLESASEIAEVHLSPPIPLSHALKKPKYLQHFRSEQAFKSSPTAAASSNNGAC